MPGIRSRLSRQANFRPSTKRGEIANGAWQTLTVAALAATLVPGSALAQSKDAGVVENAEDAFGTNTGREKVGVYSPDLVRGFSPQAAGNLRIEGMYFDQAGELNQRLVDVSTIKVGLTAKDYPFPSPTGIVDYGLRTSGPDASLTAVIGLDDYAGPFAEIDMQFPIAGDRLSLAAGFDFRETNKADGSSESLNAQALILTARPSRSTRVSAFWSRTGGSDIEAQPLIRVSGSILPPNLPRTTFFGQNWAGRQFQAQNYGILGSAAVGQHWRMRAGVIRSTETSESGFADLFRDVRADGSARHIIVADPPSATSSTSGELRLSHAATIGRLRQAVHLVLRARDRQSRFGGSGSIDFGTARIDQAVTQPRPTFTFGEQSRDHVRQATVGLAYDGRLANRFSLGLGIQMTRYDKEVVQPGNPVAKTHDQPWLFYGSFAVDLTSRLTVYGGHTQGLEETGIAPDDAANKGQALPAIHTRQSEAGLRYALSPDLKLVAAIFDVSKPYYNLDRANLFTSLGDVSNKGVEVSLSGRITPRLSAVAGLVLLRARVTGEAVALGRVGRKPVASNPQRFRSTFEYTPPGTEGLSLSLGLEFDGRKVVSRDNLLSVPPKVQFDLGAHYSFRLGGMPVEARLLMENVTNVFGWRVSSSGGLRVNPGRVVKGYLSVKL